MLAVGSGAGNHMQALMLGRNAYLQWIKTIYCCRTRQAISPHENFSPGVIRTLGADVGIAKDCRTKCFLFDKDILIDAGTGLDDLDVDSMAKIKYLILTYVDIDHIAYLPLVIDTAFASRGSPLTIYLTSNDSEKLLENIFNDVV